MASTNRKDKRATLAEFLRDTLTLVASEDVFDHRPKQFKGHTPLVYLKSAGSGQVPLSGNFYSEGLLIEIHSLALYEDKDATPLLTVESSDDTLDDLDAEIRDALDTNWNNKDAWQAITQVGDSRVVTNEESGGKTYKHEVRVVRVLP